VSKFVWLGEKLGIVTKPKEEGEGEALEATGQKDMIPGGGTGIARKVSNVQQFPPQGKPMTSYLGSTVGHPGGGGGTGVPSAQFVAEGNLAGIVKSQPSPYHSKGDGDRVALFGVGNKGGGATATIEQRHK